MHLLEPSTKPLFDSLGILRFECINKLQLGVFVFKLHSNLMLSSSGVTRVKGQPGQLTNKQPSRRSAERSWVGGGAAHRNPP